MTGPWKRELPSLWHNEVMHLTELCLHSMYFQFENQFYEQTDGAAMGSPLSAIIANCSWMEHIEKKGHHLCPAQTQPMDTLR